MDNAILSKVKIVMIIYKLISGIRFLVTIDLFIFIFVKFNKLFNNNNFILNSSIEM